MKSAIVKFYSEKSLIVAPENYPDSYSLLRNLHEVEFNRREGEIVFSRFLGKDESDQIKQTIKALFDKKFQIHIKLPELGDNFDFIDYEVHSLKVFGVEVKINIRLLSEPVIIIDCVGENYICGYYKDFNSRLKPHSLKSTFNVPISYPIGEIQFISFLKD